MPIRRSACRRGFKRMRAVWTEKENVGKSGDPVDNAAKKCHNKDGQ